MNPGDVALAEINLQPAHQRPELLLLVSGQLGHLVLAGLKLFWVVNKLSYEELVFPCLSLNEK